MLQTDIFEALYINLLNDKRLSVCHCSMYMALIQLWHKKSFELSTSLFTDYAEKQRLIKLPANTKLIGISDGLPEFPDETVLAKTFYYYVDKSDSTKKKK